MTNKNNKPKQKKSGLALGKGLGALLNPNVANLVNLDANNSNTSSKKSGAKSSVDKSKVANNPGDNLPKTHNMTNTSTSTMTTNVVNNSKHDIAEGGNNLSDNAHNYIDTDNYNVIREVNINFLIPNEDQPRKFFDSAKLEELATSIKQNGIIQPIIVGKYKDMNDKYLIIAGERRWRASRLAGLKTVPVLVRELTSEQLFEQALIENIQRQDLNAIEEADALERLMNQYNFTQEDLAARIGKSRSAVANSLRLLTLPNSLKSFVIQDDISAGHARALLSLRNEDEQIAMATIIVANALSVRETEAKIKKILATPLNTDAMKANNLDAHILSIKAISDLLTKSLGTKVELKDTKNKGRIVINYYTANERERLIEMLSHNESNNSN